MATVISRTYFFHIFEKDDSLNNYYITVEES